MKTKLVTLLLCLVVLVIQGCNEERVNVPPPEQDKAPIITVHALASGGSGQIEHPEFTTPCWPPYPCQSFVTLGTELLITVDATNSGGVESLSIHIEDLVGTTLFSVQRKGIRDSNNKVPKTLSIIGHNGAGGIGGNPLLINMVNMSSAAIVTATATNFNGMTTTVKVRYAPLGPLNADIKASPPSVVNPGDAVTLTWNTSFASSADITNLGSVSLAGAFTVSPTTTTTYTLTAKNFINQSVSKSVTVAVPPPSQPPQTQTKRLELLAQQLTPGGYRPYANSFMGTVNLKQIELPADVANVWVADIKFPKLNFSTDFCGDSSKYVMLSPGGRTTPQQLKEIYGSESPTISWIVACVDFKPGYAIGPSVGVLTTYTH